MTPTENKNRIENWVLAIPLTKKTLITISKWALILFALIIIGSIIIDDLIILLFNADPNGIISALISRVAENSGALPVEYYVQKATRLYLRFFIFFLILSISVVLLYANLYYFKAQNTSTKVGEERNGKRAKDIAQFALAAWILVGFFVVNFAGAQNLSLTTDEKKHYRAGIRYSNFNSDLTGCCYMPFSVLNAIPRKISSYLAPGTAQDNFHKLETGRIATMLVAIPLGFIVFYWARKLYGFVPGMFALTLFVLDPNIIAHSQLITTDIYAACMITIASYFFWRFTILRDWKHAVFSGITLGLSLIAKYASLYLFPIFLIIWLVFDGRRMLSLIRGKDLKEVKEYTAATAKFGMAILVISIFVLNAGYLFNGTFTRLGDYEFISDTFLSLQSEFQILENLPVPLPQPYVSSLDLANQLERTGKGNGLVYLFGRLSLLGYPGYYNYTVLYKVPIATQAIVLLAVGVYIFRSRNRKFLRRELFLLLPVLFFFYYFNYIFRSQIGIRHFLIVFPFIYIFAGRLLKNWRMFRWGQVAGMATLVIYLFISVHSYYPHYIAYFNERVLDRRLSYKILADSNLDWGQGEIYLGQYLREHPEAIYEPLTPEAGTIVVPANLLLGITGDPNQYKWLRKNFEPIDTIAYYFLIFEITPEEVAPFLIENQ